METLRILIIAKTDKNEKKGKEGLKMRTRQMFAIVGMFFVLILPALGGDHISITDIAAVSGNKYEDGGVIKTGVEVFFDKKVTLTQIPDEIEDAQFIKGWNEDARWHFNKPNDPLDLINKQHREFLTFTTDRPVQLWVLFDRDNEAGIKAMAGDINNPWLWNDFDRTDVLVPATGGKINFTLYKAKKISPPGKITIGSLSASGKTMYIPLVTNAMQQDVRPNGKLVIVWGELKVLH